MAVTDEATITFHGGSFVELAYRDVTAFVDPTFARPARRGRRARGETRKADYVFVTRMGESFDDALDVLEDHDDAILVGGARACRTARDELRLGRGRTLDLEAWERANDDAFRVTAVPVFAPTPFDDGLSVVEELADSVVGLGRILEDLPVASGTLRQLRAMTRAPLSGGRAGGFPVQTGRPGLGWLFELAGKQTVLHLANGVHEGTDERDLEEIADLADVDVLVVEATGNSVAPLVRAARILSPAAVLLFRSEDPYRRGRRSQALPVSAFADAIREDRAGVEAIALRSGDRYVVPAPQETRANEHPSRAPQAVEKN
jgi:hypothetical protein